MKILFSCFFTLLGLAAMAQVGQFTLTQDIGNPKLSGSSDYDSQTQKYSLKGSGYNIWFERDEFHYLANKMGGDFILTASFRFKGEGVDLHRKAGWMIRESLEDNVSHASAVLHGDGLTVLQWRVLPGAFMRDPQDQFFAKKSGYQIIQLERSGGEIIMRAAHPGEPLQEIGRKMLENLQDSVYAGLFICSHNDDVVEEAEIWNVRIVKPVAETYNAYQHGFIGSRLETMDVFSGERKIIYKREVGFEAPNWMPDGKKLLFNMEGGLYKIPVSGGALEKLNIGSINRNNNDHGISFDGKLLALSSHRDGFPGGGSSIYVVPLEGGIPKLVTEKTPSYWHGWAPNNQEVIYVAQREPNGPYNLYRKPIKGGAEEMLTDVREGVHVDGCEYSPDGQYIYYNGSQSGTMQIWRMHPDGSNNEQITFDENNDWFPHISPDGKWMVYISFPPSISVNDHPFYKRVTLNLMPTAGGVPKVIAHLYGGQGTINVPSWSPDSKRIAFVSNSMEP